MARADNRSIAELADAAFREAAKQVIELAIQTRTPVIVSENGVMKKIKYFNDNANDGISNRASGTSSQ